MAETLKGGLIGCGYFARHHIEAWRRIPDVQIVAACDLDPSLARAFAERSYSSAVEMLDRESLDFVDIVTRSDSHCELVALAVARRLPVICQKPIAPDWDTAVALVDRVKAGGIPFMVHENWRWQPWYREARRMILRGDLGRLTNYGFRTRTRDGLGDEPYPRQPYFRELPRLMIYEAFVHHLDTARFLFGDINFVYASTGRHNPHIKGEDRAIITVEHADEVSGWIDGHRFRDPQPDGPAMGEATIEGEDGSLLILATGDIYRDNLLVWKNQVTAGYRGDSVRAVQAHFIECLRTGRLFESAGQEYLKSFAAMEASYLSAQEHRRVALAEFLLAPQEV